MPYSGRFNVRISPEMHRQIAQRAALRKVSLNQWINEALERALDQ
jgi:predicted HicB family RNase H-like nuclease